MESISRSRFIRISPRKLKLVCELIAGKKVDHALSILEFTTANVRFINQQSPSAAGAVHASFPNDLVARGGLVLSDARPIQPGETREIKIDATDAMWERERLVSFLTDVDSKFGGLLFFVNPTGERQHAEIGGPILPVFTEL